MDKINELLSKYDFPLPVPSDVKHRLECCKEEAYKVTSQCVADVSDAIRKFGISILSDDRKWEEKE
ncbi:hypothetical protein NE256_10950 [Enterococcus faecium]|uniref:hypothetical protein n=1 Tax=Enterococcus faecium TaxID=1352 RepID=UPI00207380DE|nr:hypothetical protein [Enterococcus faecium]MCM6871277.1 hypothetical protein [Enterococcus faecium]MCM6876878.1 hypothetical protein [Enterococcus faecium]MCM6887845.1 hypothetical protein [Enterococcus faecium]MCM6890326.1 hypothetical protein [Enterococcus faecium]MCM6910885.1 hypothetical protein [Enterococcus faecium]